MKRLLIALGLLVAASFGACALLPERYAVNADLGNLLFGRGGGTPDGGEVNTRMRVPDGFSISIWARNLPGARFMRALPDGRLLVSQPRASRILLVESDANGDGRADGSRALVDGLNRPHGIDFRDGWLYVGETDAVARVRFDPVAGAVSGDVERVVTGLPEGGNHWTRTVRFGPDGGMYVSVGSSCNVCIEEDERRAALLRFEPDGSGGEVFAGGLRNSVGFDWQPGTDALYATDNGRDLLGDDFPPCELNRVERGGFYGWPFVNGEGVPDPDYGTQDPERVRASRPPSFGFAAHNAPLGIAFLRSNSVPIAYRGAALVALHGSWNRTSKDGYKVVSLHWGSDGSIEQRDFATGFLVDDDVIGRPVDVVETADGTIFVSDDYAGVIWRVALGDGESSGDSMLGRARISGAAPLAALAPEQRRSASERGRALYEANACYACHEAERADEGVVPKPIESLGQRFDIASLTDYLAAPTPPMPVFPLDADERRDLAIHLLDRDDADD